MCNSQIKNHGDTPTDAASFNLNSLCKKDVHNGLYNYTEPFRKVDFIS